MVERLVSKYMAENMGVADAVSLDVRGEMDSGSQMEIGETTSKFNLVHYNHLRT